MSTPAEPAHHVPTDRDEPLDTICPADDRDLVESDPEEDEKIKNLKNEEKNEEKKRPQKKRPQKKELEKDRELKKNYGPTLPPPYRLFLNPNYNIHMLSSIHPSQYHIRQVQHLYDQSFPIEYSTKFFNNLANPPHNNTHYQSQTLILTSTNDDTVDSFKNLNQIRVDKVATKTAIITKHLEETKLKVGNKRNDKGVDEDNQNEQNEQNIARNTHTRSLITKNEMIKDFPILLHQSVLEPLILNPLLPQQSAEIDLHHEKISAEEEYNKSFLIHDDEPPKEDSIMKDPTVPAHVLDKMKLYMKEFTLLGVPEFISHDQDSYPSSTSLDEIDSTPPSSTTYLHTASAHQYLAAQDAPFLLNDELQTQHQIIGSFVVRPSTQTVTSVIPDLAHAARTSLLPSMMNSLTSWFSGPQVAAKNEVQNNDAKNEPPKTDQSLMQYPSYHPQLARSVYLCTLAICPQFMSQGLGTLLLFNCVEFCIQNYGADYLYLHCLESNKRATNLYKKFGFVVEGKPRGYVPIPKAVKGLETNKDVKDWIGAMKRENGGNKIGDDDDDDDSNINDDDIKDKNEPQIDEAEFEMLTLGLPVIETNEGNTEVLLRSYLLPEDEQGDALYMYLDLALWKIKYRKEILFLLKKKLQLSSLQKK